jgi:hypothetical protein
LGFASLNLVEQVHKRITVSASAIPTSGVQMEKSMEIVKGEPVFLIELICQKSKFYINIILTFVSQQYIMLKSYLLFFQKS